MDGQMSVKETTGLLYGKKEIQEFLNDISKHALMKLIAAGLPVRMEGEGQNAKWIAHAQNIENWLKEYTSKQPTS